MDDEIKNAHHDYDQEYKDGAHWDTGRVSSNIPRFLEHLRGNERILDAGCGTGRDSIYLAKQGFKVEGIDQSPIAIKKAKERSAREKNVNFIVGALENLPYPNSSFDAVYSGYVLGGEELPKQTKQLARVLKDKGIMYVAMFTRTEYERPNERDEVNPENFVLDVFEKQFNIREKEIDTFSEEDDQGLHEHDRLRIVLQKK
ncbi:MAG: Methyltransferase type 11 [Candidatus Beckwithbacteria bacterium GW2011_GWB1_47_15]|uniref:Methyltransferase type 11 n=1 Tax=Candidatus Beckwithbacteria bacterium GW2011_GWB1_47_15 TaxID=1618371 RepID=A0A0G1RXL5_9BACT|nr:MAG: methyltransferase type 11 [Candidatus Beckwithbacteria bacterium GW2011_GWC1_49_16]AQS30710.1 hypothetical protein [uncultured bacterium]KKU35897.1 MAG: Methyltransferase type 11 [Candidatus Beckwithbacteria bacterium GW2011_GWA1_46_30]KKU61861.1 MAG: Methyltransferase type 11 [Candidatus Beckwithbacteria bacterium GW2011_GWB1_47_15]KKU72585.1 MAG: Methyltransferase type 11 [Candidatus Beckwithbacteria bacterium GW2011_GWA2_47_25]KKW04248.1 MAG: Methyltransferase type 11 [Candidatus Be